MLRFYFCIAKGLVSCDRVGTGTPPDSRSPRMELDMNYLSDFLSYLVIAACKTFEPAWASHAEAIAYGMLAFGAGVHFTRKALAKRRQKKAADGHSDAVTLEPASTGADADD